MHEKTITMLNFASRARKVSFGESVIARKNKVKVALLALDVGPSQKKKYVDKLLFNNIPYIETGLKKEFGEIFHKCEISLVGIEDINIAKQVIKLEKED